MTIKSDGKVGIGDTTPQALLDVGGGYGGNTTVATFAHATDAYIEIENMTTQNGAGIILTNAGTKKWTIQKDTSAHSLHIQDTSGDVMKFLQGGQVDILKGNLAFTSGYGIDFSNTSTQTGNTSVSHLFNDYEHGDFTPSHANSVTHAVSTGRYVRVGDLVYFSIQVGNSWSNITSSWQFTLDGLPFPVYAANAAGSCFARYIDDPGNTIVYVTTNEQLHLYKSGSGSWDTLYLNELNSVSAYFYIVGTYRTT
jgi:hypothetical protein